MNEENLGGFPCGSAGKESACNAGDSGWIPGSGRSPAGRYGNALQFSCLENSTDSGAWQATFHGVAKSQIGLKRLSKHSTHYITHTPHTYVHYTLTTHTTHTHDTSHTPHTHPTHMHYISHTVNTQRHIQTSRHVSAPSLGLLDLVAL